MLIAWIVFWLAMAWVGFAHVGYPLCIWVFHRLSPRPVARDDVFPPMTVIVAVHNGEHELAAKLEGLLQLEYANSVQLIVASDGSTDGTDDVARSFADRGVELVRNEDRGGKESAQASGIEHARGDIVVFTDVSAQLPRDALTEIAKPFADPSVGSVSSEDDVASTGGEGAYVRMEMWLRALESEVGSIVGNSGSFFAARRSVCTPWPIHLASDFRSALEVIRRGLRAVSEPRATARFGALDDPAREWGRKVRTARRGIAVLEAYLDLLDPRNGRVAFLLWGHKVARYTAPIALVVAFVASLVAAVDSPLAVALVLAQLGAYGVALASLRYPSVGRIRLARLAGFFVLVNASILTAWVYHLRGERAVTWQPTVR